MEAVSDYYSLHRNMRLGFINGKPKKAVKHLVSVIRPATPKTFIESKLEMNKSELKKDLLGFVSYLEEMAIIHYEHCHVVEHKKTGDSGHKSGGSSHGGASKKASDRDRTKPGHGRSSDSTGTGKQSAREPPPCLNTKK
jgi:hypothetical protein